MQADFKKSRQDVNRNMMQENARDRVNPLMVSVFATGSAIKRILKKAKRFDDPFLRKIDKLLDEFRKWQ